MMVRMKSSKPQKKMNYFIYERVDSDDLIFIYLWFGRNWNFFRNDRKVQTQMYVKHFMRCYIWKN